MLPLGMFAWFGYELPLTESLRRMKAAGFGRALLWWGEFEGDLPLAEQPDAVRRLGLEVENAHAPFDGCNALWLPGEAGDAYVQRLIACVDGCADTGVPVLVVHLTDEAEPPPFAPRGIERLKPLVERAQRRGVALAFENLRHPQHLEEVFHAFPAPLAGFCYDSGHHYGWCKDTPFLERYGSRLATLHLHDNDGVRDLHHLPFDGNIDWAALAEKLAAAGFSGAVSLEVQAFLGYVDQMDAQAFLERAYTAADRVRSLLEKAGAAHQGIQNL